MPSCLAFSGEDDGHEPQCDHHKVQAKLAALEAYGGPVVGTSRQPSLDSVGEDLWAEKGLQFGPAGPRLFPVYSATALRSLRDSVGAVSLDIYIYI